MPGSSTPKPPGSHIQRLPRMPLAHIFFPGHPTLLQGSLLQQALRRSHAVGVPRMPRLIQGSPRKSRQSHQVLKLRQRGTRRLFQQHMLALRQRQLRSSIVRLRRSADGHGVEIRHVCQHLLDTGKIRDTARLRMATRGRRKFKRGISQDCGDVLIARNLAHTDDPNANRLHESPSNPDASSFLQRLRTATIGAATVFKGLRSGSENGGASISNTSPSCAWILSAKESVAVPKKCTCKSPGLRNKLYLK